VSGIAVLGVAQRMAKPHAASSVLIGVAPWLLMRSCVTHVEARPFPDARLKDRVLISIQIFLATGRAAAAGSRARGLGPTLGPTGTNLIHSDRTAIREH